MIGPSPSAAASTVRVTKRSCSAVAPSTPSIMASRVLTRPGTGALVRIAMPTPQGSPGT